MRPSARSVSSDAARSGRPARRAAGRASAGPGPPRSPGAGTLTRRVPAAVWDRRRRFRGRRRARERDQLVRVLELVPRHAARLSVQLARQAAAVPGPKRGAWASVIEGSRSAGALTNPGVAFVVSSQHVFQ